MSNCSLTHFPNQFFSPGQYLLADSAFVPTFNVVPAFKKQRNQVFTQEEIEFNKHLSSVQVVIENCIGLLKNQFQSLKGLRLRVSSEKDMT
jgi:hypothetical protein